MMRLHAALLVFLPSPLVGEGPGVRGPLSGELSVNYKKSPVEWPGCKSVPMGPGDLMES